MRFGEGLARTIAGAALVLALAGASCDKKSVANPAPGPDVPFEKPEAAGAGETTAAEAPAGAVAPDAAARFSKLADRLPSPCGKAHSLKTSIESDRSCKRAPFAQKYVKRLIDLNLTDDQIAQVYGERYGQKKLGQFDLKGAGFYGKPNAPVVLVEFFDYGCPHCREKEPVLEQLVDTMPNEVVVYFKHFPLSQNSESPLAAAASIAAVRQGKFMAMHRLLFERQGAHAKENLIAYARELGLDVRRFQADLADPAVAARVQADRAEGERGDWIRGTPTLFVNGRRYSDPIELEDLRQWVAEELAVNR